jgi:hypothetical protein
MTLPEARVKSQWRWKFKCRELFIAMGIQR